MNPPIHCAHGQLVPTADLKPHPRNPNRHPAEQLRLLAKVITTTGWRAPIVVSARSGFIVKGHGRLDAAKLAGLAACPVDVQPYANDDEEMADMIADNRLAELAEMDAPDLAGLLLEMKAGNYDMELTGFTDEELLKVLTKYQDEGDADADLQIERAEELRAKWGVKRGQVWQLGEHRILCGDSTTSARLVLGGDVIDIVVTDPPYGVDYDGGTTKREELSGDKTPDLYLPFLATLRAVSHDHLAVYLWYADGDAAVTQAVTQAGFVVRSNLIWNKNQAQFGALSAQYKQKHEPFLYCHIKGQSPQWFGPTNEVSVWDVDRASANGFHPTQKPVELFKRAIRNSSKVGDIVFDGFLGSGTTVIACENLGRKCRAMEISPAYVAVALQRFADAFPAKPINLMNVEPAAPA